MLTFLAWVVLAAPVAMAALWVAGEYILQNRGEEGECLSTPPSSPTPKPGQPALPLSP
jgi:hypothetical protein